MPIFLLPLLNWIAGSILKPLFGAALDAWKAKLSANDSIDNHTVALAAQSLQLDQREAELASQERQLESGSWYVRIIRPLFAYPVALYLGKLLVWDKVFGSLTNGTTDPLSPWLTSIVMMIIAFYFGSHAIENTARILTLKRPT